MANKIIEIDGAVICVRITDMFRQEDQTAMQAVAADLIEQGKKPRVLVVIDSFKGWERNANWDDVGFLMEHGDDIEKIAIVADERWKEQTFMFAGKGFRTTEIEFFRLSEFQKASEWLRA